MKSTRWNKFLHELLLYFWIPIILSMCSYIFFWLHDPTLGISVLVGATAIYAMARLFVTYRKWWLLAIMVLLVAGAIGIYFLRAPSGALTINGMEATGTYITMPQGTVTVNPAPQVNGQYTKNTVVTLTAEPGSGYDWAGWTGTDDDTINPTTVMMNSDRAVTVNFEERYSLIINNQLVIGSVVSFTEGQVTINPAPSGLDGKYRNGTVVTLTVQTNPGYEWKNWTGTDDDTANPTTLTMDNSKQITLAFMGRYELTINGQTVTSNILTFEEGSITIDPAPGPDGKFALNTEVTLLAQPNTGNSWQSWSGVTDYTSNPTTVVMNSDKHITVNWGQAYVVTINNLQLYNSSLSFVEGDVTASPAPMSGGMYAKNTRLTLTAIPKDGYRFDHWGGEISSSTNPITITINSDKYITAVFVKTYALVVTIDPEGAGTVSPGSGDYDEGRRLTITAAAADGYRFDHWEGAVSGTNATVTITMSEDRAVTAVFVKTYELTTDVSPTDGGTVTPGSGTYDSGTLVTLTATAGTDYVFDHWELDGVFYSSDISILITMDGDKHLTAVFVHV